LIDIKDQLKDIPIDQVAERLGKRWYVPEKNLQAFFDEETQEGE
jgi:hypothetical protein